MIDKVNKNSNPVSSKLDRPEFREQRLYEKWACKKFWYVKTEAVPLLAGNDPEVV
ncbi:MAG: hypothetical protein GTN53_27900, partial [Candidatus Aminicenantes bacterium]|nr:hypothetical protein [Candidatus Aminicenantes bacterium]NIT26338.1 hypothetical protein [Candidatus Aminicenantes bacterium]